MARVPTYRLKKGDREITVNQADYHANLAAYQDYKRVGETHAEEAPATATTEPAAGDGAGQGAKGDGGKESKPAAKASK